MKNNFQRESERLFLNRIEQEASRAVRNRALTRQQIERDTQAYLAGGGQIKQLRSFTEHPRAAN